LNLRTVPRIMSTTTRYVVKRTDQQIEDSVIESEGLTIGRLPGNDLTLNHRTVSDTHVGIREIAGEYWVFNLAHSSSTILDGSLVDQAPLEGGATVRVGPYLLRMAVCPDGLLIIVELEAGPAPRSETGKLTSPLRVTGRLRPTGEFTALDQAALKIFWDKRRREAGKMKERSPLHPQGEQRIGKAQFNWTPTLDLKQPWRPSWFIWGGLVVVAFSLVVMLAGWDGRGVYRPKESALSWRTLRLKFDEIPWYVWLTMASASPLSGLVFLSAHALRKRAFLKRVKIEARENRAEKAATGRLDSAYLKVDGPAYPHPVIDPLLCIGCHACVEACPHNVLDIVGGVAAPVALDQCMEDMSCMAECPTVPKACVVVNTRKVIPPRKVPRRDHQMMTDVPGIYLIGDVSGVPLIKNAINEGVRVIDYIIEDLRNEDRPGDAPYDVAIIGAGPAGLSATAIAKQRGLRCLAIEQNRFVSTIQNYPAGKYVNFKPDTVAANGVLPLSGVGAQKEDLLDSWMRAVVMHGLEIHEGESCKDIRRGDRGFTALTARNGGKEGVTYQARRVILATGNHGSPMKLGVPGEDLKIPARLDASWHLDEKVKYRLSNPDDYRQKRCLVVGAGNSAVEAAVELAGFRREGERIMFTRDNEVTLVVRSDFKGDLKLANKMNVYDCSDAGRIKVFFRTAIKEIRERGNAHGCGYE
jgi:thioredoxin reductase (NADPH)